MKAQLITMLIGMVMKLLTPELLRSFLDMVLDFVEAKVEGTKSTVDDRMILPICDMIRSAYHVPDNDPPFFYPGVPDLTGGPYDDPVVAQDGPPIRNRTSEADVPDVDP
jgi:hypothetical protein